MRNNSPSKNFSWRPSLASSKHSCLRIKKQSIYNLSTLPQVLNHIFFCKAHQDMKAQLFPIFYRDPQSKSRDIEPQAFFHHLSTLQTPKEIQDNMKPIEENIRILSKQPENTQHILKLVHLLCHMFKHLPMVQILTLLKSSINADIKYEAKNKANDDVLNSSQSIMMAASDQPIALPYQPEGQVVYGPAPPPSYYSGPVIVQHNQDVMSDVIDQKKQGEAKNYFNNDNEMVDTFMQSPFKVVKRQGLSELFTKAAETISSQLMEDYLTNNFLNLPITITVELLRLLEYINDSLYSFHLLSIAKNITECLQKLLQSKDAEKHLNKDTFLALTSTFKSIAERWTDYPGFNLDQWNWEVESRMIKLLIKSAVSQKKLFAIKTLGQICRKSSNYQYRIDSEIIKEFITSNCIMDEIFRADNHPQVIAKGEEVFIYMANTSSLNKYLVDLIFNLLQKCHQNLSKSLFATLQKVRECDIEGQRAYLLQKIEELPRANCFNEETFALMKRIMIVTPIQEVQGSLVKICRIIQKNYEKLRQNLKAELITLYYQVYLMGIEVGIFNEDNALSPLKPLLLKPQSSLYLRMIESFISRLRDKAYHHSYGEKCKKTLNQGIKLLIRQERIHELKHQDSSTHLNILILLLQNYQLLNNQLLTPEELWNLIKVDSRFTKFIRYYPEDIQLQMISSLIARKDKSSHDLECILDIYNLINSNVRHQLESLISFEYHSTKDLITKYTLAPEVLQIESITFERAISHLPHCTKDPFEITSWLILARQILRRQDEKGYGNYPPFECMNNQYNVNIKVISVNSMEDDFQITVKNYNTIFEVICSVLHKQGKSVDSLVSMKFKLFNRYLQFQDLKERVSTLTGYRNFQLSVSEMEQLAWFDKSQIFDRDSKFKPIIIDCLKEIFIKYSRDAPILKPENIAEIFVIAAKLDFVSPYDSKVTSIINQHSKNGEGLTFEEWVEFYYTSALKNAALVLQNLVNLGYVQIFTSVCNFEFFKRTQEIRKNISQTESTYKILFNVYRDIICLCQDQGLKTLLTEEIIKTLNILPTYQPLLEAIKENKEDILSQQQDNTIIHWYVSRALKAIYFQELKLDNYNKWIAIFLESATFTSVKALYIRYLERVLMKNPETVSINNDIDITILQSLGRIARQSLKKIPDLSKINYDEVSPLTHTDIDSFLNISLLNFSQAMNKLADLCLNVCKAKGNICISQNALAVVAHFILKESKQAKIEGFKVFEDLIFHEKDSIRYIFNGFYYLLSNVIASVKKGYYSINVGNRQTHSKNCKQYFNVLSKILSFQEDQGCYNQISSTFQKDISSYDSSRQIQHFEETDQVLLGELKVINYIKLYNPKTIIESTTVESIRNLLQTNSSEEIRQILYNMSNSICDFETNIRVMAKIMDNLNLSRNSKIRGRDKMGIMNLGCICYINSVVQQLQMIQPFRVGIIGTEVPQQTFDFFREFQYMLYQLTFGQRIYLIPERFCLNYLDNNGNPINIKQQHDADQFLNQLFDRLENRLKNTNEELLISNNFKGQVVNVINCDKCFHKKERIETFYILSVQIKNLKTIQECISKYAEPQIICDYFCQFCDMKVESIQKYHKFNSLPPFLFIHLQRLVFDLQFMYKIKLDHPIDFPHELNLTQFFNSECQEPVIYTLKGFVVHIGSSEGGHYYSLINCQGQWIKFDDTRIDFWNWDDGSYDRNNAYMLIYEIKSNQDHLSKQQIKIGNKILLEEIKNDNFNLLKEKIFLQPSFTKFMLQTINQISLPSQFTIQLPQLMKSAYHPKFHELPQKYAAQLDFSFNVVLQYLKTQSRNKQLNLQGNYNDFHDNNQPQSKQHSQLQKIAVFFIFIIHFRPQFAINIAKEYLAQGDANLFALVYNHREKDIRQIFKTILFKAMSIIKSEIYTNFMVPVPQNQLIQKLLQKIIVSLCEVGKNPSKMAEFFELITLLLTSDQRYGEWFYCNKLGPRLIHLLMQSESKLGDVFPNYPFYLNTARKQTSISLIIEILIELVKYEKDISIECESVQIQRKAYLNFDFYRRIFLDRYENQRIPTILNFCSKNNPQFTNKVITFTIEGINRFNHTDRYIFTYLNILYHLLILEDNLQRERTQRLLGIPLLCKKYEEEGQQYNIKKETDRFCRYQNPSEKKGDEMILSFLELLYINRKEFNYFVIMGISALLNLMANNSTVSAYIQNLPGPCPAYSNYIDWITEFIYESQKQKGQSYRNISSEQTNQCLQDIASLINKLQNKESESGQNAQSRARHHNINNKPYMIKEITSVSEWTDIDLFLNKNLILKDNLDEEMNDLLQSEFLKGEYRLLFGPNQDRHQCALITQFRFLLNCKAKLSFTAGYPYTFYFEKGQYQLSIPFYEDQPKFIYFEVAEGQLKRVRNNKTESNVKKMEVQEKNQFKVRQEDFPTIQQASMDAQAAKNDADMKEESPYESTFQCPFCEYKSKYFTSRCKNCGQQWGDMA